MVSRDQRDGENEENTSQSAQTFIYKIVSSINPMHSMVITINNAALYT